jgi:hypothetical protein
MPLNQRRKAQGQKLAGYFMQQLMELYEMAAMNEDALRDTERQTILQARLALGMFERAMQDFKAEFSQTPKFAVEVQRAKAGLRANVESEETRAGLVSIPCC